MNTFTKKASEALGKYYEYGLVDPRNNEVFFRGVGTQNQIFTHELECNDEPKNKLDRINEIKDAGYDVIRVIIEKEVDESLLSPTQTWLHYLEKSNFSHILDSRIYDEKEHTAYTVDEFNQFFGAEELEGIKHNVLVIKAASLSRNDLDGKQLYEEIRGVYKLDESKIKKVEYVLVVCKSVIVAAYKPTKWCVCKDAVDAMPVGVELTEKNENKMFFVDEAFKDGLPLDDNQTYYLNKSVKNLQLTLTPQHPFTYLKPVK